MNYDDLDVDESANLLKEFFKNNPAFADPKLGKAKILYHEQKDNLIGNPLLIYMGASSVKISEKFRGVLINDKWVIYCGKRIKYYWNIRDLEPFEVPVVKLRPKDYWTLSFPDGYCIFGSSGYCIFGSSKMVDITAYVFKSQQKFINWDSQPWGDLK